MSSCRVGCIPIILLHTLVRVEPLLLLLTWLLIWWHLLIIDHVIVISFNTTLARLPMVRNLTTRLWSTCQIINLSLSCRAIILPLMSVRRSMFLTILILTHRRLVLTNMSLLLVILIIVHIVRITMLTIWLVVCLMIICHWMWHKIRVSVESIGIGSKINGLT